MYHFLMSYNKSLFVLQRRHVPRAQGRDTKGGGAAAEDGQAGAAVAVRAAGPVLCLRGNHQNHAPH